MVCVDKCTVEHWFVLWWCFAAEKQSIEQARLIQQLEDEQEADGEEDDEEEDEEEDGEQEEVWRRRRRGSPEGRPEPRGQALPDQALRKRVVANREEQEDEDI